MLLRSAHNSIYLLLNYIHALKSPFISVPLSTHVQDGKSQGGRSVGGQSAGGGSVAGKKGPSLHSGNRCVTLWGEGFSIRLTPQRGQQVGADFPL